MNFGDMVQTIAVYAIPVLLAITLHESAHGYAARAFGDYTAHFMGRITLNPMRHIDLVGTVIIPLMLYFATSGAFLFGYARPVPVDFTALRHPKKDMVWVALAGPAANLGQALLWGAALYLLAGMGMQEKFWLLMCKAGVSVNVVMFVFNLFPLPPMDGGRILVGLLPLPQAQAVARLEPYGFFIVLALLLAGVLSSLWMTPLMSLTYSIIDLALTPLRAIMLLGR